MVEFFLGGYLVPAFYYFFHVLYLNLAVDKTENPLMAFVEAAVTGAVWFLLPLKEDE